MKIRKVQEKDVKKGLIIGVSGISCSGKTLLASKLTKKLKIDNTLHVDDYWKDYKLIPKSVSKWREWERPSNIAFDNLLKDLLRLKEKGRTILVEGVYLYYKKAIRDIIDFKIYIRIPSGMVLKRRINKFGIGDKQKFYTREILLKEYAKYGKKTAKYADLVLRGDKDATKNVLRIVKELILRDVNYPLANKSRKMRRG